MGNGLGIWYPSMLSSPKKVSDVISPRQASHTSITYRVINTLPFSIFWRGHNDIVFIEAANRPLNGQPALTIVYEYCIDLSSAVDTRELLKDTGIPSRDALRKDLANQINEMLRNRTYNRRQERISFAVGITEEELHRAGGLIYLQDIDMVVGYERRQHDAYHPLSHSGMMERMSKSLAIEPGTQQRIVIIDNTGIPVTRWMNTGQEVLQVRSFSDPSVKSGVYLTYTTPDRNEPVSSYFSLEEAEEKLGLYITYEQAAGFGSPELMKKQELKDLELKIGIDKQELQRQKTEFERQKLEAEEKNRLLEENLKDEERRRQREKEDHDHRYRIMREEMELEKLKRNDQVDFEKQRRKERSEMWKSVVDVFKTVLTLITTVTSLFVLMQKNAKKEG